MIRSRIFAISLIGILSAVPVAQSQTATPVRTGLPPPSELFITVPNPSKSNLYVRVSQYSGLIKISGAGNLGVPQQFWTDIALTDRPISIPSTGARDWTTECMTSSTCANQATEWLGSAMVHGGADEIDKRYRKLISDNISRLEADLTASTGHDLALRSYVATGVNTISYRVQPLSSNWSVTFELYTLSSSGHLDVLQETHLDPSTSTTATVKLKVA